MEYTGKISEMAPHSPLRRRLLIAGGGFACLAIGGGALFLPRRDAKVESGGDYAWRFLLPEDRLAMVSIAPAILGATLWQGVSEADAREFTIGVDQLASHQLPRIRAELRQLFDLLASPGGRLVVLGNYAAWPDFPLADIEKGIVRLRDTNLALLHTAYDGLRELIFASWYGNPAHWSAISYPGTSDF